MESETFRETKASGLNYGDSVLLYSPDGKTFLVRLEEKAQFHSHLGVIAHRDLVGRGYGDLIQSQKGNALYLLEPTTEDFIMKSARKTAIMYPKDIGLLLLKAGVRPGARIIEMGSGSGGLAIALATAVAPHGRIYSYDKSPVFQTNARRNVERAGLHGLVEYKIGHVADGFVERQIDVVAMDIPVPWEGIAHAWEALRGGGRFVSFLPTYNQVERTAEALQQARFVGVECVEVLHRYILARQGKTRPFADMIGHTGFLVFARKVQALAEPPAETTRDGADALPSDAPEGRISKDEGGFQG